MKKIIIRIFAVLILLVVVALVVVFFSLNSIVKKAIETIGPKMTQTTVTLGAADISPFSGSGKLSKLVVGNPQGYNTPFAIKMDSIKVGVQLGSVTKDTVVVNEINIQGPEIQFDGGLSGNNLSKLEENLNSSSAASTNAPSNTVQTPSGPKQEKKLIVKDLLVQNAKVHLNLTVPELGKSISATVPIPDIHLQDIGTAQGGVTPEELCSELMKHVKDESLAAAKNAATSALKGLGDIGQKGASALTNVSKGIGNLFKKSSQ